MNKENMMNLKNAFTLLVVGLISTPATGTDLSISIRSKCEEEPAEASRWYTLEITGTLDSSTDNEGLAGFCVDLTPALEEFEIVVLPGIVDDNPLADALEYFDRPLGATNPPPANGAIGLGATPVDNKLVQIGGATDTVDNEGAVGTFPTAGGKNIPLGVAHTQEVLATVIIKLPDHPGRGNNYTFSVENGFANVIREKETGPVYSVVEADVSFSTASVEMTVPCQGDINGDDLVDTLDSGLAAACYGLTAGEGNCDADRADVNGDGTVDTLDVGLIEAAYGTCQ
jgi:uncharacterized protein (DUF2141 family)